MPNVELLRLFCRPYQQNAVSKKLLITLFQWNSYTKILTEDFKDSYENIYNARNWNTETTEKNNLSRIYKLNDEQYNMTYIGEIGRKFLTRFKVCETSQRQKDGKSLFGKQTNDEQHTNKT